MTHEIRRRTKVGGYGWGSEGRAEPWRRRRQVVLVRVTRELLATGPIPERIVEDHYYLSSLSPESAPGSAASLLVLVREHWGIENRLHHVKDRTMREDDQRAKAGAIMMARLRALAVGLHRFISGAWTAMREDTVQNNLFNGCSRAISAHTIDKSGVVLFFATIV